MFITTNILVNRMARWLESNIWKYAWEGNVMSSKELWK
jgi:hypothetical protein